MSLYEIRVSKSGKDVLTSTDPNDFIMHSRYNTFKIIETGMGTKTASGGAGDYNQTIALTRPNASCYLLFVQFPDGKVTALQSSYLDTLLPSHDYSNYQYAWQTASPGTVVTDGSGTKPWENVNDAKTSNNVRAYTVFDNRADYSDWLKCTNFGFTIPTDAIITGVKAEVEGAYSGDGDSADLDKLIKGGSMGGTEYLFNLPENLSNEAYVTTGGTTNLWGNTLTPSDINNSGFGLAIWVWDTYMILNEFYEPIGVVTTYIDHVRLTVYYNNESTVKNAFINTAGNTLGFTIYKPGTSNLTIKYRYFIFEPPL